MGQPAHEITELEKQNESTQESAEIIDISDEDIERLKRKIRPVVACETAVI